MPIPPLSIKITPAPPGRTWKSIGALEWRNIPTFAVLTGVNGSGKTQLLEFIHFKLNNLMHQGRPAQDVLDQLKIDTGAETFGPGSTIFLPSTWDMGGSPQVGISELLSERQNMHQNLLQNARQNALLGARRVRLERQLGRSIENLSPQELQSLAPDDFAFMLEDDDVVTGIAHVAVAYKTRLADLTMQGAGMSKADAEKQLGPPPWLVVNQALKAANFRYEMTSPMDFKLSERYHLQLQDRNSGIKVSTSDLSSGEKAIFRTLLWLFRARQEHGRFAKLYLLDEPDAHLHPSMTQSFIDVLSGVLANELGIRIILATHSPSTVALAPEGSVFEMYKEPPRIRLAPTRQHAVSLLTAGMVVVAEGTKFVFVEDEMDSKFYGALWEWLTTRGAVKPAEAILERIPSLAFLGVSIGSGGGINSVTKWVEKFNEGPLKDVFRGCVDKDVNNSSSDARIKVIARYSIENYLIDPVIVFGSLIEIRQAPIIAGVSIAAGDEHLIRNLDPLLLQQIVDFITTKVSTQHAQLQSQAAPVQIQMSNGATLNYPDWMINHQGHGLLSMFSTTFGSQVIERYKLIRMMNRVRLIPQDLVDTLRSLQNPSVT